MLCFPLSTRADHSVVQTSGVDDACGGIQFLQACAHCGSFYAVSRQHLYTYSVCKRSRTTYGTGAADDARQAFRFLGCRHKKQLAC